MDRGAPLKKIGPFRRSPSPTVIKEISPENVSLKLRQVLVLFFKLFHFSNAPNHNFFSPAAGVSPLAIPKYSKKKSACGGRFHLVMLKLPRNFRLRRAVPLRNTLKISGTFGVGKPYFWMCQFWGINFVGLRPNSLTEILMVPRGNSR